jgi:small-conductance mechanosensitive channel
MKSPRWVPPLVLGLAVAAAVTGLVLTRDRGAAAAPGPGRPAPRERVVDERCLRTARRLEPLAATREEKELALHALRLAAHEVDLAFADALRQAAENPPPLSPHAKEQVAQKARAEEAVKADQARIAELERRSAAAQGGAGLETQIDLAKAQLELDQDELDQTAEDLERTGADPQSRIRRLQAAHAAADSAAPAPAPAPNRFQESSLLGKLETWTADRVKTRQLADARREVLDRVEVLTRRREARAQKVELDRETREQAKQAAAGLVRGPGLSVGASAREAAGSALVSLQRYMLDQRTLADLGRRMQDGQDLAEAYEEWSILALAQQRTALHVLLRWLLGVLLVLALVYLADRLFERLFRRLIAESKRVGRMLKMLKVTALAVGTVAILLVLLGLPSQLTTLLGLAGAGLTVALKDFIMAFFGWFVLVGRNGIHVGDWVEINGVGGEVLEIGLLRTLLLETGSWSDLGHPTGRVASFVNSFAMGGHFFNFSTSGQWMWDELRVLVPAGQDPYPIMEAIQQRVERETEANARVAEAEWRQSDRARRVEGFSARPGITMVPALGGVEIQVRYITRAHERHETRRVLNQTLVDLLHGGSGEQAPAG